MSINKPGSRRNGLRGDAHSAVSGHSKLLYFALALLLSAQYWSYQHCQVQFGTSLLESFTANANSFTHLIGIDAAGGASSSSSSSEAPPMFLKKHYDVCIAGAGLSGAVLAERYATQMGKTVLVVEKRDHIGGNCYDYIDKDTGVRVSQYGAHLFHTYYDDVWDYVQQFGPWTPYEHKVRGIVNGKHVPIPVNIETVNTLFNLNIQSSQEMDEWLKKQQIPNENPTNSEEVALSRVGKKLYDFIFKPYTFKQWNRYPAELGPEVLQRIPVRNNWEDRYFSDPHQALPTNGYTSLFENMLKSQYITVLTSADYFEVRELVSCGKHYFTGPIDAYFAEHNLPKLEYRSLNFERHVDYNTQFFQPAFVVNHPQDNDNYTRIVEYKHLYNQSHLPHTVYFIERSQDGGEPYYPVPNERNKELFQKYQALADEEMKTKNVSFVGRLANYKYFNMDQAIKNALDLFEKDTGIQYAMSSEKDVASEHNTASTNKDLDQRETPATLGQPDESASHSGYTSLLRGTTIIEKVPDWRQAVDCSPYDNFCGSQRQRENRYREYPFPYGKKVKNDDQFQYEAMKEIPSNWAEELKIENSPEKPPPRKVEYVYPPEASSDQYKLCLDQANNLSWQEQLTKLLESSIKPEAETNMVAFTISDYNYAFDMMHDFFEMNDEIVGFQGSTFMVALDKGTLEMACKYNYPVLAWPSAKPDSTEQLKQAVANTKFEVSHELVVRGIDFFFYEMDVWWLQSPKAIIKDFHSNSDRDVLLSSHQNCPMCLNIGVYSVTANEYTKEYFANSVLMATESPNTHDQWIMGQLLLLADAIRIGKDMAFQSRWDPLPKTNPPPVKYPVRYGFYNPHEIVANERPIPTHQTLAIHTLCSAPLKNPHGKKILAKEVGAWYGFSGPDGEAGYYKRKGKHRRYLWMDGHLPNSYSLVMNFEYGGLESNLFNDKLSFTWTIATLLALARRTGRSIVLPKLQHHHGVNHLWATLDLESVKELGIDYKETSFPNNPKAWHNSTTPFQSVARTALGAWNTAGAEKSMFAQFPGDDPHAEGPIQAWRFEDPITEQDAINAWWAMHTAVPEIDNAELLLVNPHFINSAHLGIVKQLKGMSKLVGVEREIADIHAKLRWCWHPTTTVSYEDIVGRSSPDYDCYGRGELYEF